MDYDIYWKDKGIGIGKRNKLGGVILPRFKTQHKTAIIPRTEDMVNGKDPESNQTEANVQNLIHAGIINLYEDTQAIQQRKSSLFKR